jgi:hypothetical protein
MKTSRHSRALLFESLATMSTSNTTATDASTIWGPGTLSGKVIEAFGEATLRGVEIVVIRRKLSTYRSLFPHADDTAIKDIDSVYENVLELSRYCNHSYRTVDVYTSSLDMIQTKTLLKEYDTSCTATDDDADCKSGNASLTPRSPEMAGHRT